MTPGPLTTTLTLMTTRAAALPDGEVERHVQVCVRRLASACLRRDHVRDAVDRTVAAIDMLQQRLRTGARRRAVHDLAAVERLLDVFQEDLLPALRRDRLI